MIRLYNCQTEIHFNSVREACQKMGFSEATLYNKQLPCEWGGFYWERLQNKSQRHICCTRCGKTKWDTDFYKASKQGVKPGSPIRVNQPCKDCIKEKKTNRYKIFPY